MPNGVTMALTDKLLTAFNFQISAEGVVSLSELCSIKLSRLDSRDIQAIECFSSDKDLYMHVVIADKYSLSQCVMNAKTKRFHQQVYSYNLQQQFPFYSYPLTKIEAIKAVVYDKERAQLECLLTLSNEFTQRSIYRTVLCQEGSQVISPADFISQIDAKSLILLTDRGQALIAIEDQLFNNQQLVFKNSNQLPILDVKCNQDKHILLDKAQISILGSDFKVLKKQDNSLMLSKVIGVIDESFICSDALGSLYLLSKDNLSFQKVVSIPQTMQPCIKILRFSNGQYAQWYKLSDKDLIRINSKYIFERKEIIQLKSFHPMLYFLESKGFYAFNLSYNDYERTYTFPQYFRGIAFQRLRIGGKVLVLAQFQAFYDTTQEFPEITYSKIKEYHLIQLTSSEQISFKITTAIDDVIGFKYFEELNLLILIGVNQLEFYFFTAGDESLQRLKFKNKITLGSTHNQDEFTLECLELEHSEKQELLRDKENKVSKEDLEVFEAILMKERIVKTVSFLEANTMKLVIVTDLGFIYGFQVIMSLNALGKPSLVVEQLAQTNFGEQIHAFQGKFLKDDELLALVNEKKQVKVFIVREFIAKKQKYEYKIEVKVVEELSIIAGKMFWDKNKELRLLSEDAVTRQLKETKLRQ